MFIKVRIGKDIIKMDMIAYYHDENERYATALINNGGAADPYFVTNYLVKEDDDVYTYDVGHYYSSECIALDRFLREVNDRKKRNEHIDICSTVTISFINRNFCLKIEPEILENIVHNIFRDYSLKVAIDEIDSTLELDMTWLAKVILKEEIEDKIANEK